MQQQIPDTAEMRPVRDDNVRQGLRGGDSRAGGEALRDGTERRGKWKRPIYCVFSRFFACVWRAGAAIVPTTSRTEQGEKISTEEKKTRWQTR